MFSQFSIIRLVEIFISSIVLIVAAIVMYGWIFSVPSFTSLIPGWLPMKFITAFCFVLSAFSLLIMSTLNKDHPNLIFVSLLITFCLSIFLLMCTIFILSIFGLSTGIENLFVQEISQTTVFSAPGLPSGITIIDLALFALSGIIYLENRNKNITPIRLFGSFILLSGIIAAIGYLFNFPLLMFVIPGFSTAIAFSSSILFIILGIGLIILKPV